MLGNRSWKNLVAWDRTWLVVVMIMSSSHLELFISGPTEGSPFVMMAALLSTVYGSLLIHPSRYQTFRSDLTSDVTPWMVRTKRAGPRRSPCHTPVAESRQNSPWKRCFWRITVPYDDRFLGGEFELLEELCLGRCYHKLRASFSWCSNAVKNILFCSFCTPTYNFNTLAPGWFWGFSAKRNT